MDYKYCIVPCCGNTTIRTPKKLFIHVPKKEQIRNKWLQLASREQNLSLKSRIYFCEDHFDLPNDMENFMEYHIMGSVSQIRLKRSCVPSKFACQPDWVEKRKRKSCSLGQSYISEKRSAIMIDKLENESVECTSSNSSIFSPEQTSFITIVLPETNVHVKIPKIMPALTSCNTSQTRAERERKNVNFFNFPKDLEIGKKWIARCKRDGKLNSVSHLTCSEHFMSEDFHRDRKLLEAEAVPPLLLLKSTENKQQINSSSENEIKREYDLDVVTELNIKKEPEEVQMNVDDSSLSDTLEEKPVSNILIEELRIENQLLTSENENLKETLLNLKEQLINEKIAKNELQNKLNSNKNFELMYNELRRKLENSLPKD